ncbi:MAG: hypothetical protein K9H61_02230 [Bacteroidia bacterium]|nr:hypothetical protein [Bacteroidia bacterium]MCF8427143.1 hypothetical protein [Bacteroidia bacterium]MCF8445788.1 hypothetical protein [Bacteroidia bacterium]
MDITTTRREAIDLFNAVTGLSRFSTQAGYYIATNVNILSKTAKEHDKFYKTLQANYSTKKGEGEETKAVMEEDGRTPKIEGENITKFEEDYEKFMDETITIKDLRPFEKKDLVVRSTEKGKSELVQPDLPGALLGPCILHGLITGLD